MAKFPYFDFGQTLSHPALKKDNIFILVVSSYLTQIQKHSSPTDSLLTLSPILLDDTGRLDCLQHVVILIDFIYDPHSVGSPSMVFRVVGCLFFLLTTTTTTILSFSC